MELRETTEDVSERRQVTILHCDLVGSTELSAKVEPEELQELIHKFLDIAKESISIHNGHMAGFTGDGIEAYFGYPIADEDAAANALLSAELVRDQVSLIEIDSNSKLKIRIGIATGNVITEKSTGEDTGKTSFAFGLPAPLAARLEEQAPENSIYIDQSTYSLCKQEFEFERVGELSLKGFPRPIEAYRHISRKNFKVRFEGRDRHLSPFVGRAEEISELKNGLEIAKEKSRHLSIVVGEPGVGKSRLTHDFTQKYIREGMECHFLQCSSKYSKTSLYPFLKFISDLATIKQKDVKATKREKILNLLEQADITTQPNFEVTCGFLDCEDENTDWSSEIDPKTKLRVIQNTIAEVVRNTRAQNIWSMIIEDVHWIDPTSLELIFDIHNDPSARSLQSILTTREDIDINFCLSSSKKIELGPLSYKSSHTLISNLSIKLFGHTDFIREIQERSGGNPLYIEEVAKNINKQQEEQKSAKVFDDIPIALNGILLSILDKLPRSKKTAQIAATIGREFDINMILHVSEEDEASIRESINTLQQNDVIYPDLNAGEGVYYFKHALVQEAAYQSQLKKRKRKNHLKIAESLRRSMDGEGECPEIIAYHFQEASMLELAFEYWTIAGDKMLKNGATREAVSLLRKAQSLFPNINPAIGSKLVLREFYLNLAKALNASEGAKSNEAVFYYGLAAELSEELGDIDSQVHSLDSQFGIIFNSGSVLKSYPPAEKLVELGRKRDHKIAEISGLQSLGMIEFIRGNFVEAKSLLEEALVDSRKYKFGLNSYPSLALMYLSWTCLILGESQAGKNYYSRSIESGRQETDYSLMVALGNGCYFHCFSGNLTRIEDNAKEMIELATKTGQHIWLRRGRLFLNWLDVMRGNSSNLKHMSEEVESLLEAGEEIETTFYLCLLAMGYLKIGRNESAMEALTTALTLSDKNEERFYLSQIHKVMSQCWFKLDDKVAGNLEIKKICTVASQQSAHLWM